ncbi:prepilin-type N-terminal cleavage/methylation domain-containing protein [Propionivibrio sp.]|uniref:prepilin-type N-terminal cleavage/methylation domain-containing protein n=1 Tax=Propionivibrio sp. TaxID=2212460 RepID=UPI00272E615F|nr:prepilin-type N-terminal cleavage/methylation domain-containing protein [Propionivibrio sp.]
MKRTQSGFTLVEIAIVLVIIGLLLGGVLKGQELVNSAKVKNFVNDFKTVPLFIYGYQDKYRALPGDDPNAKTHVGATLVASNGTLGNGLIEGNFNSTTGTHETVAFWEQVRLANLASGPTDFTTVASAVPTNADGGRIGVQSKAPIQDMTGSYFVCSDAIQGKFAKQIDVTMDDGNTDKGSVRVMASGYTGEAKEAVATKDIVDSTTYTVCASF